MPQIRGSIGPLMLLVMMVAADFAVLRLFMGPEYDVEVAPAGSPQTHVEAAVFVVGGLPMLNLLLIMGSSSLWRLRRNGSIASFSFGFQIAGWIIAVVYSGLCGFCPALVFRYVMIFVELLKPAWRLPGASFPAVQAVVQWIVATLALSLPGMLSAILMGRLIRRGGPSLVITAPRLSFVTTDLSGRTRSSRQLAREIPYS